MRKIKFQNNEYYHIYNRGVDKRDIFMNEKDFVRFLTGMREFNRTEPIGSLYNLDKFKKKTSDVHGGHRMSKPQLVEVISYCLNTNHYHCILKQLTDGGISEFMKRLADGYTKYFNYKYKRSGSLFGGRFKSIHVKEYSHLLKLLVYVNCNYEVHGFGEVKKWVWSSYLDSIGKRNGNLCDLGVIKEEFETLENFKKFYDEIIPEIKLNKELQKYLLE